MISRSWSRKSIAVCLAIAVLSVYSMVALAQTTGDKAQSGELSVSGQVTVNGQAAISGATVFSGSTVATGPNSSAAISFGKLGRVELFPNSSAKLILSATNIAASPLDAGRLQVFTFAGTSAIVTTKDGQVVADQSVPNTFIVDIECGDTRGAVQGGHVELRADGKTKLVAEGTTETAGQAAPGTRCTRLATAGMRGLHGAGLAALLAAVAGAVIGAIIAATKGQTPNFGGTVVVVSPTK